jgi:PKD repeat protein
MKKHLLIIVLIALIACITMPVSAYTVISTYSITSNGAEGEPMGFYWGHAGTSANVTKFTSIGTYKSSTALSGSHPIEIRDGGCGGEVKGYAVASWNINGPNLSTYYSGSEFSIVFNATPTYSTSVQTYCTAMWVYLSSHVGLFGYKSNGFSPLVNQPFSYVVANPWAGEYTSYSGVEVLTPIAAFSCSPTSQYPDTSVVCTDSSTNTPTDWYWTIDAEAMGIDAWQTHTGQNFTWESHYPGFYSVNLRANNSAGSSWENKTNYVIISENATPNNCDIEPAAGYIRTYAQTNDGMTSGMIYNSDVQMKDVEGSAWSNVTNSGGVWCIDTLPGHSLNLYAQATGYSDVESIGVSANGGRHYLVMWPDYIPAPSAGNVTLYALIYDQQTGSPLYLSTVRVDGNSINTVLKNTGPEGQAMFTIKNDTSIHVTASKSGYSTITKVLTTSHLGPDTVMISLPRSTITGTPTATPTPSWMTTVPTVGPGPGGTYAPGYTNNQGQKMMDFLATNGMSLVELCFMVTILALLGVKLGK